jgi:hypothetical protein
MIKMESKPPTQEIKIGNTNIEDHPHLIFTSSPEFPEIYEKWNDHLREFEDNQSSEFKENRYKIAQIGSKNIKKLCSDWKQKQWSKYVPNFEFTEDQLKLTKKIAEEIKPTIESCIGNFRIINTKASETLYSSPAFGPNEPHKDGVYPKGTYKAFVYLTPPDRDKGTSGIYLPRNEDEDCREFDSILVEGELGMFLFFDPVSLMHSGIIPLEPYVRMMLEFIIVPSEETIIEPSFHGTNSTHPIDP